MNLKTFLIVPAAALALVAAGCGSDDDKSSETSASPKPAQQTTAPAGTTGQPSADAGGEDAVKQVVLDYTFKGSCETMTDKFLEQQAFIGDNRQERCDYFEKTFQKPQYQESDVKFRALQVNGDKATALIGSDIANVKTEYTLVNEGGQWKIDAYDIKS